jgi:CheY-like chemotaxis protein
MDAADAQDPRVHLARDHVDASLRRTRPGSDAVEITATATPEQAQRAVRIVTVDDQPHFHASAKAIVAAMPGFTVVAESRDGPTALRDVSALDPDMVIVDVRMNGMDGVELTERLRGADPTRVLVLATTVDTTALAGLARSCGASALVRKHWLTPRLLRGLWVAHRRR